MKIITTQDIIDRSIKVHGYKYSYEKTIYNGNEGLICIICPIHGEFWQKQATHLVGRGCVKCSFITIANKTSSNVTEFIEKAKKIHGNKYDYSNVEYKNANTKVKIICKEHGEFKQNPRGHLSNNGCPSCNKYVGYSKSQWINYNKEKEGIFYIIKVFDENEIFYKIGITGKSIQERYKYTGNIPYNYEIIEEIKSKNLEYIWNLEKENKKILKDFKYKPLKSFAGSSVECFSKLNKKILKLN